MDVNFGNVASNVQPGTASAYSVLRRQHGDADQRHLAEQPDAGLPRPSTTSPIPGSAVFTLFMLGDARARRSACCVSDR